MRPLPNPIGPMKTSGSIGLRGLGNRPDVFIIPMTSEVGPALMDKMRLFTVSGRLVFVEHPDVNKELSELYVAQFVWHRRFFCGW